jgi:hypothetical protein
MNQQLYKPFSEYILRTPLFPFNKIHSNDYHNSKFNEALFIASRDFYNEKEKYNESNYSTKIHRTIKKYYSRACTRCTPFGLFAGFSLGRIGHQTTIKSLDQANYKRYTTLSNSYISCLIKHLEKQPNIRSQILYFPNDSIYTIQGTYRYIEESLNGTHTIVGLDISDFLSRIIRHAEKGITITELSTLLIDENNSYDDCENFINELINIQFLKSNFGIALTGGNNLDLLINKLSKLKDVDTVLKQLETINNILREIDNNFFEDSIQLYNLVESIINNIGAPYDKTNIYYVDLYKPLKIAEVSDLIISDIQETINFLIRMSSPQQNIRLVKFKKDFFQRYGSEEIPLLKALDVELGIGYGNYNENCGNEYGIIDDIPTHNNSQKELNIHSNKIDSLLFKKYIECIKCGSQIIELFNDDILDSVNSYELPDTFSVMCSIIQCNTKKRLIYIESIGGSSAMNLFSKYSLINNQVNNLCKAISYKESEVIGDYIVAEIVYNPPLLKSNLINRDSFREYEIHYLTQAGVDLDHSIPASDLMISIRNNCIYLRSRRLNRYIIPKLSTSHNYSLETIPLYRFLCDIQNQGQRGGIRFSWGNLFSQLDYLPRVIYGNAILSRQRWIIYKNIIHFDCSNEEIYRQINEIRRDKKIPQYVVLTDNDNELFLDFDDLDTLNLLISLFKNRSLLILEEFLFEKENAIIDSDEGSFCNEFIFPFFKDKIK